MSTRRPKIIIKPSSDGQWVYQYIGANGEPMMTSETVVNEADAIKSANSIRMNAHECVIEVHDAAGNVLDRVG
jgi:uncharacterized protein YegP (UPF0339 family)